MTGTVRARLLVALGGGAGAALRWLASEVAGARTGLVVANLVGTLVLALLLARSEATGRPPRPELTTGLCGALTTMSALAVATVDDPARLGATATICVLSAVPVVRLGRRLGSAVR